MPRRRQFLQAIPVVIATGFAVTASVTSTSAQAAVLDEQDPQAVKLGYKADTTKVDAQKFPKHKPSQTCANCQLYQGDSTSATGGCVLFGSKEVAAKGWCTAWEQG